MTADVLDLPVPATPRVLRIGLVAPPWVPVPPPQYGGTELMIDQLARGLMARGHDVTLFTTGDSLCPVHLRWIYPEARGISGDFLTELGHVQAAHHEFAAMDIVHDHTLTGPLWAMARSWPVPMVATVHGEFTPELTELYEAVGRSVAVVAISHDQRTTAPTVPVAGVIRHGIDVEALPLGRGDGGYVLFLGRMHPDKGVHLAITAARQAGKRIIVAAKMREPAERRYYAQAVEPLLGPDAEFVGEVGGVDKLELLGGAEALVNPITWHEPFGLVMIEALAVGTPVVTFARGAAPEIVDHGFTGFLCTDALDMAAHLARVGEIDRGRCRRAALERFSTRRMVDDHLALYTRLLDSAGVARSRRDDVARITPGA